MENCSFGRRSFLVGTGATGLVAGFSRGALAAAAAKPGPISFGYATITWRDKPVKTAIAEIAAAGFRGVQLRLDTLEQFPDPAELKGELERAKLTFACFSGGSPSADVAKRAEDIEKFMKGAKYAKAAGALCIQTTSPKRPAGAAPVDKALLKGFAETLNELGKRTGELGLPLAVHPHMDQIVERPEEVEAVLAASDPKHVKFLLDIAHYQQGGGDPVKAIKTHGKRLGMLHIKDVADNPEAKADEKKYRFVELGQGKVDLKAVFAALKSVGYRGWAVVELDAPAKGREPKDTATASKAYLEKTLGVTV